MTLERLVVALTLLAVLAPSVLAGPERQAGIRRKELRQLEKDFHFKELIVRRDVVTQGPPQAGGRFTELRDGSYYEHADATIAFEKLAPVRIEQASLRRGGRAVLLQIGPASDLRPWYLAENEAPQVASYVALELEIPDDGTVREALRTLVFMPDEAPTEEDVKECLGRYPDMPPERSRLRCFPSSREPEAR